MISGKVLPGGVASIRINIRGSSDAVAQVETIIDTGFTDQVALPPWVIEKLGLQYSNVNKYTLGDGTKSEARVFAGLVEWNGSWRSVSVVELDCDPLVGMDLLNGCNLSIDVVDGGDVKIQPLPPAFAPQPSLS